MGIVNKCNNNKGGYLMFTIKLYKVEMIQNLSIYILIFYRNPSLGNKAFLLKLFYLDLIIFTRFDLF